MADELDSGGGECHPAVDRMVSMESGATSDSWDDDYQDYYDEEVSLKLETIGGAGWGGGGANIRCAESMKK